MGKLTGKVALVTGASAGLGKAIAQTLANEGATVILTGRRENSLQEVQAVIGDNAYIYPADMTDQNQVAALFEWIQEEKNWPLDIVVNNVGGVIALGKTSELSLNEWQKMQDLNATSQFLTTKYALPLLRQSQGKLIAVTSGMAHYYMAGMGAYSASKASAEAFIKTVAVEEEANGIQVNLFDPINAITASNPKGQYDPMDLVQPLVELVASPTVIKQGEVIRPQV